MASIRLSGVDFTYKSQTRPREIFRQLELSVSDGEFLSVLGPSGSGKSTLLMLLAGLLRPDAGTLFVGGVPTEKPGLNRGVVFQDYSLFPWMTCLDNVAFCAKQANPTFSRRQARDIARGWLNSVGLADSAGRYPKELSGGMRQRVALARALVTNPTVLLCDEPFGAVDPKMRSSLQVLLQDIWLNAQPHKTVVFVTHDIEEALLLSDRIVFMRDGRLLDDFPVALPRPRGRKSLESAQADALRRRCVQLFNESGVTQDAI